MSWSHGDGQRDRGVYDLPGVARWLGRVGDERVVTLRAQLA